LNKAAMPLYHRTIPFEPSTASVQNINPTAQYFYLDITGEVFQDYESYLERLLLCKSRQWTCSITGKNGLTFQEALASEREASRKISQEFNEEIYLEPLCRLIHLSYLPLERLVDAAYTRFKKYYCIGEKIRYNGREWQVDNILSSTGKPFKEKRAEEFLQLPSSFQLTFQLTDGNETIQLTSSDLGKKTKSPISKVTLKLKIREISWRQQQKDAPILVKPELAAQFGLIWFDPTASRAPCLLQCQNNDGKTSLSIPSNHWSQWINEVVRSQDDCLWPEPVYSSKIPSHVYGDVVYVWKVAHVFGDTLGLVPFSLNDLENALCYQDRNALLDALFQHLVILCLDNHEDIPENSASRMKSDADKSSNNGGGGWETVLVRIIRLQLRNISSGESYLSSIAHSILAPKEEESFHYFEDLLSHWIQDKGYRNMNASERLVFLRILCDIALGAEAIRKLVENELEEMQDRRKKKRIEVLEARQNLENEIQQAKQLLEKYSQEMKECGNMFSSGGRQVMESLEEKEQVDRQPQDDGYVTSSSSNVESFGKRRALSKRQMALREERQRQEQQEKENEIRSEQRKLSDKIALLEKKYRTSNESLGSQLCRSIRCPFLRWHPLGVDRCLRRYWLLEQEGILFVEVPEMRHGTSHWGYYNTRQQLHLLYEYLNERISGEAALKKNLDRRFSHLVHMMKRREAMKEATVKRLRSRTDQLFLNYPRDDGRISRNK
jgi:hypothetical protein